MRPPEQISVQRVDILAARIIHSIPVRDGSRGPGPTSCERRADAQDELPSEGAPTTAMTASMAWRMRDHATSEAEKGLWRSRVEGLFVSIYGKFA
jgi:hypothetical protein